MDKISKEATLHYFASLFSEGQLLKERICSWRSKFFPLRVDSILKSYAHPEKQIGIHASLCNIFQKRPGRLLEQGNLLGLIKK